MRACMAVPRYPPNIRGGGETSCSLLVKELSKHLDIEVVSFDGHITGESKVDGIDVIRIKPTLSRSKMLLNAQACSFFKKKVDSYDIFHTYNMDLMPAIGHLTREYGIKSVATLNGIVYSISMSAYAHKHFSPKFYRNKSLIHILKKIDAFTALCPFYRDNWVKDGIPKEKIAVIPNMINLSLTTLDKKASGTIRIVFVGNFANWRGLDILLQAYSSLEKQDIELTIVGDGWEKYMENKIENIKNNIKFMGGVPYQKIPQIYVEADILVQPYRYPVPIGRSLIEALRSQVCVITAGDDYYSPVIKDMEHGVLIYPMDPEKLAEKIQMLIDDPALRERLAKNGKNMVYETCSPEVIVKRYLEVYEGLI